MHAHASLRDPHHQPSTAAGKLLAFTTLDMTPEDRDAAIKAADDGNGLLDRAEFVDLCVTNMSHVGLEQVSELT